jgi:hypothetical protein
MKTTQATALAGIALFALAGCGSGDDTQAGEDNGEATEANATDEGTAEAEKPEAQVSECESAVEFLAESNNDEEYQLTHTFEAVDEAILACPDFETFEAATDEHPDAVEGTDAETLVSNRCAHGEEVSGAAMCDEV